MRPVSSSVQPTGDPSINRQGRSYLLAHPQVAAALPTPDEVWAFRDIDALDRSALQALRSKDGVLVQAGTRIPATGSNDPVIEWRVSRSAHAFIERCVETPSRTPCGHTGVRCLAAGETYTCHRDDCDATFGRAAAQEVLEG